MSTLPHGNRRCKLIVKLKLGWSNNCHGRYCGQGVKQNYIGQMLGCHNIAIMDMLNENSNSKHYSV